MKRPLLALAVAASLCGAASAQSLDTLFAEANEAAFAGRYDEAAQLYERLLDARVEDADVEFNLGTVHAQAGRLGHAILHFERALRIRPRDPEAERSLEQARRLIAERRARAEGEATIDTGGGIGAALARPFTEAGLAWALLALELLLLLSVVVAVSAERGSRRRVGSALLASLLLLGLAFTSFALVAERGLLHDGRDAIVLRDRATLREGPDPRAAPRGEAREGDWAVVLGEEDGFLRVRTGGNEGWAERDAVGAL